MPLTLRAAVLLAARVFPNRAVEEQAAWRLVVDLADAHFLATGQMHLWDGWSALALPDQVRITRMLRQRPAVLAHHSVFVAETAAVLDSGEAVEFAPADGQEQVLVLPVGDEEALIDALLDELEDNAAKGQLLPKPAPPGSYVSDLRIRIRSAHPAGWWTSSTISTTKGPLLPAWCRSWATPRSRTRW
ncbi:hypothetical protein [Streptomyces aureocirculatus]|uniref:hypothetical protein n=1 Tax=Streptomyces aureocirculatus TaxID=67275 RepID=UPI000B1501BA|nr:hypothetical protein [Streptomyces aureocirculatus]